MPDQDSLATDSSIQVSPVKTVEKRIKKKYSAYYESGTLQDFIKDQSDFWGISDHRWTDSVLATMSLDQKIGQLMMVAAYSNRDKKHADQLANWIEQYHLGGLIFFQGGPYRQAHMTNRLQQKSKVPLFIAIDGEWGLSMRLDSTVVYPKQLTLGAIQNPDLIKELAGTMADECKRMGIHINFAPVLDVNSNANNPVIGFRAFGENKKQVTRHGAAFTAGMQNKRIMATGKHFPGHGDTDSDSHKTLPSVKHSVKRLDSLELYPFRELCDAGLKSMMVAHLNVPSLDSSKDCPASLSSRIINGFLRDSLQFRGLVFTDALNMKGVSAYLKPEEICVKALQAGNDVLLFPEDIPASFRAIKAAIENGSIRQESIDMRCAKVLLAKQWAGAHRKEAISTQKLSSDLNSTSKEVLNRKLFKAAVTLARNQANLLPLRNLETEKTATVTIGNAGRNKFAETTDLYWESTHFEITKADSKPEYDKLIDKLKPFTTVLISVEYLSKFPDKDYGLQPAMLDFIASLALDHKVILNWMGNPYALRKLKENSLPHAVVVTYEANPITSQAGAEAIFGGIPCLGKLPVSAGKNFVAGQGTMVDKPIRLGYTLPEELGIEVDSLRRIDDLVAEAIGAKAIPGCQVWAAYKGKVFFHKTYGKLSYQEPVKVDESVIYDLASITKIASTTLAAMRLVDQGKLHVDSSAAAYIPVLKGNPIGSIKVRDFLTHRSGFSPFIPFYKRTLKDGKPSEKYYSDHYSADFPIRVSDKLYLIANYPDSMLKRVFAEKPASGNQYVYSDLNFYLMRLISEALSGKDISEQVDPIYRSIGAYTLGYLPLNRFDKKRIAPQEKDDVFRKTLVHGDVHDQGAAMTGGIAGHAGLFSNANDLGKLMQMMLQKGSYGGTSYFKPQVFDLFNKYWFAPANRRGLGFDKPDPKPGAKQPCAKEASPSSFGHSGFTGTFTWVDPERELVYVFLSNRIHPNAENGGLNRLGLRSAIHSVLYKALPTK